MDCRDEAGDTLVEVLAALVIIGLTVVSILGAFATTLAATVEQRNLANYNATLRGLVETANYQIALQPQPAYVACAVTGTYQSIADAYKATRGFNGTLNLTVQQYVPPTATNGCNNSPSAGSPPQAPLQPQPQMLKATVGPAAPSTVVWDTIYFVVSDPHVTDTSGISPAIATAGATVTITGTGFSNATQVNWGSATIPPGPGAGHFVSNSAGTQITLAAPTAAQAGSATPSVTVTTPNGTSPPLGTFTYLALTSITPTSGPVGTLVTLTGTGFTNAHSVIFGSGASAVTVPSSSFITDTSTTITLDVPAGVSGMVPVSVTSVTNSVTYTSNAVTFTVTIVLPLSPSTLPSGTVGTAYNQSVTASGGTSPYTYSVSSGSLPTGLNLNTSTGAITGSPTAAGSYTFTITATDSANPVHNTGSQSYTVTVNAAASSLTILSVQPAGGSSKIKFSGNGASGSSAVTVKTCAVNSFPCSSPIDTVITGSSPTNPWTTGSTGNNYVAGTKYYAEATQGSSTSAVFPFVFEGTEPAPTNVTLAGTAGQATTGDTAAVTFSEPLSAPTICSAWVDNGTTQSITNATIQITNNSNSLLTVTSASSCSNIRFGTVALEANYVSSGTLSFINSTVSWNPSSYTLTFTLGTLSSGTASTGVAVSTPKYTATSGVTDLSGNAVSTAQITATALSRL